MAFPITAVPAVTRERFPLNSFAINGNLVGVMILCLANVLNLSVRNMYTMPFTLFCKSFDGTNYKWCSWYGHQNISRNCSVYNPDNV